jgi:O-antigen/teichoic acid export membrane protein
MMSQFKRNILANFVGKCWSAFIALAFIPLYIRLIGIEAYGLVGLFTALQMTLSVLDLGLSTTVNREVARLSLQPGTAQEIREVVRTLETVYWGLAVLIAAILIALAPAIASHWIHAERLSSQTIQQAVLLMGLATALQFPTSFYAGGLLGLQRQVLYNGVAVTVVTLRAVGAVIVLWRVSATIQAFLAWQAVMSLLLTAATGWLLWAHLPAAWARPRFRAPLLAGVWHFAAGMTGLSILGVILTQLDKLILSRMLTLEQFGYYSLATVLASGLYLLASPVYTAAFPRFSQLASGGDAESMRQLYHKSCQLVAVTVLPTALIVAVFSRELLFAWTGSAETAAATHRVLSLLMLGTALNTLAITPQALQLAHGWTRLALVQNVMALVLLTPLIVWMAARYGAVGAAAVWIALNAGYVLVGLTVMHRRLLPGELRSWYLIDTGRPLAAALGAALVCRWLAPAGLPRVAAFGWLAAASMLALTAAVAATPHPRQWVQRFFAGTKAVLAGGTAT